MSNRRDENSDVSKIGVQRKHSWITNLVKVFLFKDGHRRIYEKLGTKAPKGYERERFHELGLASRAWLERELAIAKPRLVITLGAEVAGVLHGVKSPSAQTRLLRPELGEFEIGTHRYMVVHCAPIRAS